MKKSWLAIVAGIVSIGVVSAVATPITITDTGTAGSNTDGDVQGTGDNYAGSSSGINGGFGDVLGSTSSLFMDSDLAGNIFVGHQSGGGGLNDVAVMYIDSISGGFADTTGFTDTADPLRSGISATDGANRADITFASGFEADYALAWGAGGGGDFAGVWELVNSGSHNFQSAANFTTNAGPEVEMNFALSDIGLSTGDSFDYVVTYLNASSAFRSDEFHGVAASTVTGGNIGQNPVTLANGDFNTFQSVPEPSAMTLMAFGLGAAMFARRLRKS